MKIGMVTACYHPVINGVTRMVDQYAEQLQLLGHEVTIFTLGRHSLGDGSRIVRSNGLSLGSTGYFASLRYNRAAQRRLAEMDIVHCHHLFMSIEFAHQYATCPIVYTNHTRYDLYTKLITKLPQQLSDWLLQRAWPRMASYAHKIIAPSAHVKQLMHTFGVTTPITVIPNGIELGRFQQGGIRPKPIFPSDCRVGIYVGRISAEKSPIHLIEQFYAAYKQCPSLRLIIVGDGPARRQLLHAIDKYGLQDVIHYAGEVAPDVVPCYLNSADFFVTTSQSEVHPLTVIEALAAGLPVVAYDCAGMSESIADGENGLLISSDDMFSEGILRVASDDCWRNTLSSQAIVSAERFTIDNTVRQTVTLYDDLLRQHNHPFTLT